MDIQQALFWFLTATAIGCALGVVLSRNPINSVICLILTFFAVSGHYILLNAQFLGIVNIIVYAGAIMVLFLFVIMLMNLNGDAEPQKSKLVQLAGAVAGGILFLVVLAALRTAIYTTPLEKTPTEIGLIRNLGRTLFSEYVLPFEISSVLFLSAMIGAVVIGKREEGSTAEDLAVKRQPNQN
jgi:NADH-quinone oxidoreductase subunit J